MSGRAFLDQRAIVVDDLAEAAKTELPGARAAQARWGQRSQVTVPLVKRGESIGVLTLARRELRPFTDRQIELVRAFADQAVIAIENACLFEELQDRTSQLARSVDELRTLGEVGQAVSSSLDLEEYWRPSSTTLCGCAARVAV